MLLKSVLNNDKVEVVFKFVQSFVVQVNRSCALVFCNYGAVGTLFSQLMRATTRKSS